MFAKPCARLRIIDSNETLAARRSACASSPIAQQALGGVQYMCAASGQERAPGDAARMPAMAR